MCLYQAGCYTGGVLSDWRRSFLRCQRPQQWCYVAQSVNMFACETCVSVKLLHTSHSSHSLILLLFSLASLLSSVSGLDARNMLNVRFSSRVNTSASSCHSAPRRVFIMCLNGSPACGCDMCQEHCGCLRCHRIENILCLLCSFDGHVDPVILKLVI